MLMRVKPVVTRRAGKAEAVPMLLLDLDGTVRQGKDELGRYVDGPQDVHVFAEAVELMRRWRQGGGRIVALTNQGGVALGHVRERTMMQALAETQRQCHNMFDQLYACTHHPDAADPLLRRCWCRKPLPGMVIAAAIELAAVFNEGYPPGMALMVGDRDEDQRCAQAANVAFMWAKQWRAAADHDPGEDQCASVEFMRGQL